MKMKKTSLNTTKVTDRKIKRLYLVAAMVVAAAFVMAMPAFADDPLTTINKPSARSCWASASCKSALPSKATMPARGRKAS